MTATEYLSLPECCYELPEMEMIDPTFTHVTPIIIRRGETGYWKTDWTWKKEFAVEAVNAKNLALGVTPEVAEKMKGCSMFGWPDFVNRETEAA